MTFPVEFHLAGRAVPAHFVFELLAYTVGFQLYLFLRRRQPERPHAKIPFEQTAWVLVGCVFGALVGSKLLAWAESPLAYWNARANLAALAGGKTIVGGLLGGWIGVEIAKKKLCVSASTGDGFVFPLILGMALGRVGCFLTGLPDHTHGVHASLPWAVDFGDGPRHPAQLYEIAFLIILGVALVFRARTPHRNGELFRLFMLAYLAFRFAVEFIKPTWKPYLGISAIQLTCLLGSAACIHALWRIRAETAAVTTRTTATVPAPIVEQPHEAPT